MWLSTTALREPDMAVPHWALLWLFTTSTLPWKLLFLWLWDVGAAFMDLGVVNSRFSIVGLGFSCAEFCRKGFVIEERLSARLAVNMKFPIYIHIHIYRFFVHIHGYIYIYRHLSCVHVAPYFCKIQQCMSVYPPKHDTFFPSKLLQKNKSIKNKHKFALKCNFS